MMSFRLGSILDYTIRQLYRSLTVRCLRTKRLSSFDGSHPVIFTLSTGRVGSQTLSELLKLGNNILAYHEPAPKLFRLSKLAYQHEESDFIEDICGEAFWAFRETLFNYSLSCGKGYAETSPQATFLAPIINQVIPNVKFIHLIRNPGDVIRSGMRRKWFAGSNADNTRIVPKPSSEFYQEWNSWSPFEKNVWLWAETNRWIREFCLKLPSNQTFTLKSESIFELNEKDLQDLFPFIGIKMPSKKKSKRILTKRLNAQEKGSFPVPSKWTKEMNQILFRIAGQEMRKLNYS